MTSAHTTHYSRCRVMGLGRSARMDAMSVDNEEQEARRGVVDQARASSALEGQQSSAQARADQEAWVRGEISIDELLERVRQYE